MCKVLRVSRSGYYAWLHRPLSARAKANEELLVRIKAIHEGSRGCYGVRRVYAALKQADVPCSYQRVARLMKAHGIRGKVAKAYKKTTDSSHSFAVAANTLNRDFTAQTANRQWVSDVTYLRTGEGWLYLAVFIDLYSRAVVGWSMKPRLTADLVCDALKMALQRRSITPGLLIHSDRGIQYVSKEYQRLLSYYEITCSMSRRGDCWDNAVAESFFHTLKTECVYHEYYSTRQEAKKSVFNYIEVFYNRTRLHSYCHYQAPLVFEQLNEGNLTVH